MNFFIMIMLLISIFMIIMFKNWFIMWMFMEINLYLFLLMLMEKINSKFIINKMFMYYFIQSFSSMMFIFSNFMLNLNNNLIMIYFNYLILFMAIMIKLGMFPFYHWYLNMMNNLNWMNCFILSTIQKIIPLFLMLIFMKKFKILLLINIFNLLMSSIGGINQTFLKMLMTFSSLNQLSWIIFTMMINEFISMIYLMIYYLLNFLIIKIFLKLKFYTLNNILFMKFSIMKLMLMLNMFSLGGIPPLMGFILKWMSNNLIKLNFMFLNSLFFLMIFSSITFFYYLNIIISSMLYYNLNIKIIYYFKKNMYFKMYFYLLMSINLWMLLFNKIMY